MTSRLLFSVPNMGPMKITHDFYDSGRMLVYSPNAVPAIDEWRYANGQLEYRSLAQQKPWPSHYSWCTMPTHYRDAYRAWLASLIVT